MGTNYVTNAPSFDPKIPYLQKEVLHHKMGLPGGSYFHNVIPTSRHKNIPSNAVKFRAEYSHFVEVVTAIKLGPFPITVDGLQ